MLDPSRATQGLDLHQSASVVGPTAQKSKQAHMDQAQTKVNAHNQLPRRHGQKDDARAHGGLFALPEFAVFQRWDVAFFSARVAPKTPS
jgi:hypothetical protein